MKWPHNDVPDGQYADLIETARAGSGVIDHTVLTGLLTDVASMDPWLVDQNAEQAYIMDNEDYP